MQDDASKKSMFPYTDRSGGYLGQASLSCSPLSLPVLPTSAKHTVKGIF